jgi:glutamine synthetase
VNLCMSARNRSAACRIPMYSPSDKAKRVEFRCPDPSCNGYLTFSAMLMAALDGIKQKMDPGKPMDVDVYELSKEELANTKQAPGSLSEAVAALEKDHEFRRPDRDVDSVETGKGDRRNSSATASARVPLVL